MKSQNEGRGGNPAMHCISHNENLFENFICDGTIKDTCSDSPVNLKILCDTGSTQSVILKGIIPNAQMLDENVMIRDLSGTTLLLLGEMSLNCPYVSRKVKLP